MFLFYAVLYADRWNTKDVNVNTVIYFIGG